MAEQLGAEISEGACIFRRELFFQRPLKNLHTKVLHSERPIQQSLKDNHVLLAVRLTWRRASSLNEMPSNTILHARLIARVLTLISRLLLRRLLRNQLVEADNLISEALNACVGLWRTLLKMNARI